MTIINTNMRSISYVPRMIIQPKRKDPFRARKIQISVLLVITTVVVCIAIAASLVVLNQNKIVTSTTTTATSTSLSTTTTVPCATGYVRAASGSCVNTNIDRNNCGSIGYVCSVSYISCSYGVCSSAPAVMLAGGVNPSNWSGSATADDSTVMIPVPFSISLYSYSTTTPYLQTNGVVCLGGCSTSYSNANLPSSSFSGPTAFGFWDDLSLRVATAESVYYDTTGIAPNRELIFEFYASRYASGQMVRFQILFFENTPNVVQYKYYQADDGGSSATIGVQASGTGLSKTYAYNKANAIPVGTKTTTTPTLILTFNTNNNTLIISP